MDSRAPTRDPSDVYLGTHTTDFVKLVDNPASSPDGSIRDVNGSVSNLLNEVAYGLLLLRHAIGIGENITSHIPDEDHKADGKVGNTS